MANNLSVKDGGGSAVTLKTTDNAGTHTPHHNVDQVAGGQDAHDAPASGNPLRISGKASAAAPSAVSTDGDAVEAWFLRNGARATVITAAGALIGGDAGNGLDVDVTRLPALPAGSNNIGDVDVLSLPTSGTGTRTQVGDTTSDSVILAGNANRKGATIFNDSSATLLLGLGTTTVTATNYTVKLISGAYYEVPFAFTAQIRGLWESDPNDGAARVTEIS